MTRTLPRFLFLIGGRPVTNLTIQQQHLDGRVASFSRLSESARVALPARVASFLDAAVTATARGTFYNTKEEQARVLSQVHQELFSIDRGIYAASLLLPGVTDYTRQLGIRRLLETPRDGDCLITVDLEREILDRLCSELPPQRVLNLLGGLRAAKINNARTRKLTLRYLLGSASLELWAVKYRRKIAKALEHAWGKKLTSILRSILAKGERNEKEQTIVERTIRRSAGQKPDAGQVEQCVAFILGIEKGLTLPRLVSYREAKQDIERGRLLPYEVLEGIRSRFHRNRTSAEVLELTKRQLTAGQKIGFQRKAHEADITVTFDPAAYDAVRLYIYAYTMGMTDEIRSALASKARQAAQRLPMTFGRVGILVDGSASMVGHRTQRLRPISVALALRDLLCEAAEEATVLVSDGRTASAYGLLTVRGDTTLARGLIALLRQQPEVVFVLSDGYENAPSGRTAEVINAARRLGVHTPIHQMSPVFSAENQSIRRISEQATAMPVSTTEALGLGLLKTAFTIDVDRALAALFRMALPASAQVGKEQELLEQEDSDNVRTIA